MDNKTPPRSCCNDLPVIDFTKMEVPTFEVNWCEPNLWISVATIVFNPFYWNTLARWEYRSHGLSKIFRYRALACNILAASIFALGIFRDFRFNLAMESQPRWYALQQNWVLWLGYGCISVGTVLVLTSFYALGFYGTFLGDYFGILMEEKVTGFPFNIIENPMYWGSTLNFLGASLVKASQAGLLLSMLIAVCYKIAIQFEGPFTAMIYAEKERNTRKNV